MAEANTRFWVSGRVTLDELSEALGEHFEDKDITTVGGLIFQRLGRVPRAGRRSRCAASAWSSSA